MEYYGIIDLGTNTFHLLIASWEEAQGLRDIYRERRFIKLAEGGVDAISPAAFERGLQAIEAYKSILDRHRVRHIRAIGTAALRTAGNGILFIREVKQRTGLTVQLISGDEEARLIHLGVQQIVDLGGSPQLIMDIGGGSVEFIIANASRVFWAQSFPIGLAVLYRHFHQSDPITEEEKANIRQFLNQQLQPLQEALERHPIQHLVGASGIFDVLADLLTEPSDHPPAFEVEHLAPLYEQIGQSTYAERVAMEGLPESRADMIVVALILLDYVVQTCRASKVVVSRYALKEGALYEEIKNLK
jgi:exopolyphosphatase/guanosine-5'-triphosphate,3'-diphosphate pyrophosphatase